MECNMSDNGEKIRDNRLFLSHPSNFTDRANS